MERIEYVPIGSIVLLKGGVQKVMVVSRALNVLNGDRVLFFDYAAVSYPEGLVSEKVIYFNNDQISQVVFEGYHDEDDKNAVDNINLFLNNHPEVVWGNPDEWVEE